MSTRLRIPFWASGRTTREAQHENPCVIGAPAWSARSWCSLLTEHGHDAIAAARRPVSTRTRRRPRGNILKDQQIIIDISNSPTSWTARRWSSSTPRPPTCSTQKPKPASGHHVALSVVRRRTGSPRRADLPGQAGPENFVGAGPIPYTIVHATQFFEFLRRSPTPASISDTVRNGTRLLSADRRCRRRGRALPSPRIVQPGERHHRRSVDRAFLLPDLLRTALTARGDAREVVADPAPGTGGSNSRSRTPLVRNDATLFDTRFEDWILETAAKA